MSLGDYLGVLRRHLDGALVDGTAWRRIVDVSSELGDYGCAGLECRLGAGQSRVDLGVNLLPGIPRVPERFLRRSEWRRLFAFCEDWARSGSALNSAVEDVWLEFDLLKLRRDIPIPAAFIALRAEGSALRKSADLSFLSPHFDPGAREALGRCLAALAEGSRVGHIGMMLSRSPSALRVNVEGLAWHSTPGFLRTAGWPGSVDAIEVVSDFLAPHTGRLVVALDVDSEIGPSVGLECSPRDRWLGSEGGDLIEAVVAGGLCTTEKADALMRWPGVTWRSQERDAWPSSLLWADRFMQGRAESALLRFLNHIKVSLDADGKPTAKAYLFYRHTWVDRGAVDHAVGDVD